MFGYEVSTKRLRSLGLAGVLALGLVSCQGKVLPTESLPISVVPTATPVPPTATPVPPTATPEPTTPADPTPEPTATPEPSGPGQHVRGAVRISIGGIDKLPLSRTFDYIVASTMTWETSGSNKKVPIVELSIRGSRSAPCLSRPCGDRAGLVVRVTANANYDAGQPDESRHCGSGVNYHERLALGSLGPGGSVDVDLQWDESGLLASTPVDSVFISTRRSGSFGFGRFLVGAPFGHGERGFGWDSLSIDRHGGWSELLSWNGENGQRARCP